MTENEKNEIIASIRAQLVGDPKEDIIFLESEIRKYTEQGGCDDLTKELLEIAIQQLPKEKMEYLKKTIYIGQRRLDMVYAEAARLMNDKLFDKALVLTGQLYEKVMSEFKETEERRFFSFRNLLESNLYYHMYHPSKHLEKTPFDFPRFLAAHAYNLIEVRRPAEAVPVLEDAIRFNPVNPDPRFELAEAFKLLGDMDMLLTVIRETLPICVTPYALSRCYANMGYYCVEIKDYENAVRFYYESLVYAKHPAVPGELRHVSMLMGKKIEPPTRKQVLQAFADYELPNGPSEEVLGVATALANQAVEKQEWEPASFYLRILRDLTQDAQTAKLYEKCMAQLEQSKSAETTEDKQ